MHNTWYMIFKAQSLNLSEPGRQKLKRQTYSRWKVKQLFLRRCSEVQTSVNYFPCFTKPAFSVSYVFSPFNLCGRKKIHKKNGETEVSGKIKLISFSEETVSPFHATQFTSKLKQLKTTITGGLRRSIWQWSEEEAAVSNSLCSCAQQAIKLSRTLNKRSAL